MLSKSKTINNAIITLGDTDDSGKGRHFQARFIQPGIAGYPGQFGNVLITKESLDRFINTIVGAPVIINHKDLNKDNADDERVGVVNSVWYDNFDGWFWCDGIIWNETALNLITDEKWSVSCSYDVKVADDKGGSENNIKYDIEFLDGVFTHLALVNNPRYERANIVLNSKELKAENGFITLDETDESGGRKVIWVPFNVLSEKARKRISEIADNFKEGDEIKFDFSHTRVKPSDEQINYIKDTIKEITTTYKFKGIAQVEISSELNKGSLGVCCSPDNCSVISLSPQLYTGKHDQDRWNKGVESGFHPKGTGEMIKSVLVHELGHAITCNSNNEKFWNEIVKIRKEYLKEVKKGDIKHPDFISGYARTNRYEFVAEAFCQGHLAKNYGKYTKQVMDAIQKHFAKNYQTKLFNAKDEDKNNDEFWMEEYGFGYPIDEESYEEFREKLNKEQEKESKVQNSFKSVFIDAIAEVVTNCLGEIYNSFPDHKGRPGKVGGSLPREKDIKYNLKDLLGEEIKGVTGQDAINKVYKERKGHVKDAFYKDGIGNITVCWGDDTCGLKHLEQERLDRNQDPKEIIQSLGKIIKNGHIFKEEDDRWKIRYKDATVIISKELKNEKAIAIITGYKTNKKVSKN